jgi:hypothetical protein
MASHDAPVKTPAPSGQHRDPLEWSGESRSKQEGPILDEVDARQGVTGHNVRFSNRPFGVKHLFLTDYPPQQR